MSYDLPGFGARVASVADQGELSLDFLAAEAGEILSGIDTPVIVVGQSLGHRSPNSSPPRTPNRS